MIGLNKPPNLDICLPAPNLWGGGLAPFSSLVSQLLLEIFLHEVAFQEEQHKKLTYVDALIC